jgi:5-methyltetrahydrofolate--homocysteine methyltransferase
MILIGEKINATIGRTRKAIEEKDGDYLRELAKKQVEAGCGYLDVNVGTGKQEIENMRWIVAEIERVTDVPLAIDTADESVLEAGLEATTSPQPPIINSINAEQNKLKRFLPYIKEYNAWPIALAMGKEGVPKEVAPRLRNCATIAQECEKIGLPIDHILFDPLLTPHGTDQSQTITTLKTMERIKDEFPGARICIGLSNISFGLPSRKLINSTFAVIAISRGLDAVILNPLDDKLLSSIKTAEMLMGRDRYCKEFIKSYRAERLVY